MIHIFIINTLVAPPKFADMLKEQLSKRSIRYYVFSTSKKGMEKDIAKRLLKFFEGEKIRFYCCGGSGTFRNVVSSAIEYGDVEFAFCPLGTTNDFLKVFGKDKIYFNDIDNLIDGNVEQIDYINTNHGIAINTVSWGADAEYSKFIEKTDEYVIFGKTIAFWLPFLKALTKVSKRKMTISFNGEVISDTISEAIIGNGFVLGGYMKFTDKYDYRDGKLSHIFFFNKTRLQLSKYFILLVQNRLKDAKKAAISGEAQCYDIHIEDNNDFFINFDGEVVQGSDTLHIEVVNKGLKFVIPKMIQVI